MILKRIHIVLILWAATYSCLLGATRYVSHSGSNTFPYTTWETAANTIEAANLATLPGDTMFIDTGSFYLSAQVFTQPNILIRGRGMDSTRVLGADSVYTLFWLADSTTLEDMHCIGHGSKKAAYAQSYPQFWRYFFRRCSFSDFSVDAINLGYSEFIEVRDCYFETWNDYALFLTDRGDYVIENNTFYMPDAINEFANFIGNMGAIILNKNIFVGGGWTGIQAGGGTLATTYNLFYNTDWLGTAQITGARDILFAQNSVLVELRNSNWPNEALLVKSGNDLKQCLIYNNIFAGVRPRVTFFTSIPMAAIVKIMYNCFYSVAPFKTDEFIAVLVDGSPLDSVYSNVYADPMLVDPDNGDLRLQKGSPCIDAGAPWILDVDGSRSDIGAFGGPDGEFYIYQDLPPQQPQKFDAWRSNGRVIIQWQKNTESDFRFYILFRSEQSTFSLDSANVLAYLSLDAKPIGDDHPIKHLHSVGSVDTLPSKELYTGYIPIYSDSIFNQVIFTNDGVSPATDYYYVLVAVDSSLLTSEPTTTVGVLGSELSVETETSRAEDFESVQNYPNPFNATTAIVYSLPNIGAQPAPIQLTIFNSLGQQVRALVDDRQMPGRHIVYWNSDDDLGRQVASGIYFYRLEVSGIEFVKSGKMILMK